MIIWCSGERNGIVLLSVSRTWALYSIQFFLFRMEIVRKLPEKEEYFPFLLHRLLVQTIQFTISRTKTIEFPDRSIRIRKSVSSLTNATRSALLIFFTRLATTKVSSITYILSYWNNNFLIWTSDENPLSIPMLWGWAREVMNIKQPIINYRAPCGRRLSNIDEVHGYLCMTGSKLGVDLFSFDILVQCFKEFKPKVVCAPITGNPFKNSWCCKQFMFNICVQFRYHLWCRKRTSFFRELNWF